MRFFPLSVSSEKRRGKRTSVYHVKISVPNAVCTCAIGDVSFGNSCRTQWGATKTFGSNGRKRRRLSRDCQEIRRMPRLSKRERERWRERDLGEKENISDIENNHGRGRRCEGAERIRWFRVREGTDDDGCLLPLSGAFAFPSPVCFATRGTRVLHVYQREGRCRVFFYYRTIVSLVLVVLRDGRIPRKRR